MSIFNTDTRRIRLIGDIEEENLADFMEAVDTIIGEDEAYTEPDEDGVYPPITLELFSYGGKCHVGFAIYDVLRMLNNEGIHPIECEVYGACESMAVCVMLGCDQRRAHPHTTFMIHNVWGKEDGTVKSMKLYAEEMRREESLIWDIYRERTNVPDDMFDKISNTQMDYYFGPEEALRNGFITAII